jgi:hypothetical protein
MTTNEKKHKIFQIMEYLRRKGYWIDLDINSQGGRIFEFDANGKEGRDISERLKVNELYCFCRGMIVMSDLEKK